MGLCFVKQCNSKELVKIFSFDIYLVVQNNYIEPTKCQIPVFNKIEIAAFPTQCNYHVLKAYHDVIIYFDSIQLIYSIGQPKELSCGQPCKPGFRLVAR